MGRVYFPGDCNNTNAIRKPFHVLKKFNKNVIAIAGPDNGKIIFRSTLNREFPITMADSSNSFGIESIYPFIIHNARGMVCVLKANIAPMYVSINPKLNMIR